VIILRNSYGDANPRYLRALRAAANSLANQNEGVAETNAASAPTGDTALETEMVQSLRALRSAMSNGNHASCPKKKKKKKKIEEPCGKGYDAPSAPSADSVSKGVAETNAAAAPTGDTALETEMVQALRALRSAMSNGNHTSCPKKKKKKKIEEPCGTPTPAPCTDSVSNGSAPRSYDPSLFEDSN
jgi:macrodomain Ter protein organizer (MatP/YcbG family)